MTRNGTTKASSSGDDRQNYVPQWLRPIASIKLYSSCETHSRERNFYCRVCMVAVCKECKEQHELSGHDIMKAYKAAKVASFRMDDLKTLWDVSDIYPQNRNKRLVAFVYKRGDGIACSRGQSDAAECQSCRYRLNSQGAKYCSVQCKVEAMMKMNGSGSITNEAKRKVETASEGSASNVKSFRKRPRKQKNPQRAPFF